MRPFRVSCAFVLVVALATTVLPVGPAQAIGTWNGQNTLHVPLSWCAVQGSPAAATPNVAGDTTTDNLLWRRHERPTDNIYENPAGISFRSAIDNTWGTLNFPIIADADTTLGTQGDVRGEDVNNFGQEFNQLLTDCDDAWTNLGRAGIGVTAVNIGAFHDGTGAYFWGNPPGAVIGWGGCSVNLATNVCVAPYNGIIMVADNHYLYPGISPRTLPGTTQTYGLTDPLDQLVGHELGHALGLPHRTSATALMNPGQADNNMDGNVDNVGLNANEVTSLRNSALGVPGLEQDPLGAILKGDVVARRVVDETRESGQPAHRDLASVEVVLDTARNEISFRQRLFGPIPRRAPLLQFWTLLDADNNSDTGARGPLLESLGMPKTTFAGAEFVIRADVEDLAETGAVWRFQNGTLVQEPVGFSFDLHALVVHPYYVAGSRPDPKLVRGVPANHIATVTLANDLVRLALGQPFRVQAIVTEVGVAGVDKLDEMPLERGVEFVLEHPSFPQCSPRADGLPGQTVDVDFEGLLPNSKIHALLGPRLVFTGTADGVGGGTIPFPVPADTAPGLHLVTIGVDGTALTADCELLVTGEEAGATLMLMPRTLNLRSRGLWVTARIQFDEDVASRVDSSSVLLEGVAATRITAVGEDTLLAKFSRPEFAAAVGPGSSVQVCVEGRLTDGRSFTACDTIRVLWPRP